MNKKLFFSMIFFSIIIILIICIFKVKTNKVGNTNINQDDVKDIFNMKEYKAEVEVTVTSNKNENKYKIKQQYKKNSISTQEILEPENLKGIKITTENNKIKLENTDLNLTKIFEGYNGIEQNDMDLHKFINDFEKNISKSNIYQNDEQVIIETISENNKYVKNKTLYINRKTGKPSTMEVKDVNKKTTVYIVYNKVEMQ